MIRRLTTCSGIESLKTPTRLRLHDLSPSVLSTVLASHNLPKFRAEQLLRAAWGERKSNLDDFYCLSKAERAAVGQWLCVRPPAKIVHEALAKDGTVKWLLELEGGAAVETVFIPGARGRGTLCVSCQVGCSLSCTFCRTGTQPLVRSLTQGEVLAQVLLARARMTELRSGDATRRAQHPVTHIVFMGQGEPLYAWRAVAGACGLLVHPWALGLPPRRITVSTAGVAPGIAKVARDAPGVRLAVSLHAPSDELRSQIMAINKTYNIDAVLRACAEYVAIRHAALAGAGPAGSDSDSDDGSPPSGRPAERHNSARRTRVSFEYALLAGVNDSVAHARQLAQLLLRELPPGESHVNVISYNTWAGAPYVGAPPEATARFVAAVHAHGVPCTVRKSRGDDVLAACGQLHSAAAASATAVTAPPPHGQPGHAAAGAVAAQRILI